MIEFQQSHYRLAYSYVKNADDAMDVVQESIVKAISANATLSDPSLIKAWFYRILINTALDFTRRKKRAVSVDEETLSDFDPGTADQYQDIDLQQALDNLPEPYRSIIVLRYFEDMKIEEVAAILSENVNTVKTRLYKALKKLRIQMDDREVSL